MVNRELKSRAQAIQVKEGLPTYLRTLIIKGFFDTPVTTPEILGEIKSRFGRRIPSSYIQVYMKRFMESELIRAIRIPGKRGNHWCVATLSNSNILARMNLSKKELQVSDELFSKNLMQRLGSDFETEIDDLRLVFGKSGTCTAFLLRKILEKLIYLTFAKNHLSDELKDADGNIAGLKTMLDKATKHKVDGIHFLTPKTAKEVKGIKFLGDTAAHNPLVNVDMRTILPQMPFIITAFEELSQKL